MAQPAQEPVAWLTRDSVDGCWYATAKKVGKDDKPLYATPPQRPWVDLTEDEIEVIEEKALTKQWAIRMALAAVKERNA